jgi:ABC-2 type transport system permease protein
MQIAKKPHPFLIQLLDLTLIQLSNWRWSWRSMLITSIAAPMLSIAALGTFARDSGADALSYILVGNVVLSLMFENLNKVSSNFSFMRSFGTLNYFATLPVHRYILIVSTVISFTLLGLPALVVTLLFGAFFLKAPLDPNPLALLAILLAAFPLAGIGALIGSSVRSPEEAGPITLLVTFLFLGIGPVMIPPDRLPPVLLSLGWMSPATYAASALRQTLLGPVTGRFWMDIAALNAFTAISLLLTTRNMDWRSID